MIRPLYSLVLIGAQPLLRRKLAGAARPSPATWNTWRSASAATSRRRAGPPVDPCGLAGRDRGPPRPAGRPAARAPGLRILLTHGTATGRAEGRRLLREGDAQAWLPWDTPAAVRRFLDHFRPSAGILMETEVWPNMAAACHARRAAGAGERAAVREVAGPGAAARRACRGRPTARCAPLGPDRRRRAPPGQRARRCRACSATSSSTPRPIAAQLREGATGARPRRGRW